MKHTLKLLATLLVAPMAVEILAAENLRTDHPVEMRGQGRDLQQSGLDILWDYADIAKQALDAEVISSRIQDGYKIDAVYINGAVVAGLKNLRSTFSPLRVRSIIFGYARRYPRLPCLG
jgi:hypothetical protein